jgi:hypothetical protein
VPVELAAKAAVTSVAAVALRQNSMPLGEVLGLEPDALTSAFVMKSVGAMESSSWMVAVRLIAGLLKRSWTLYLRVRVWCLEWWFHDCSVVDSFHVFVVGSWPLPTPCPSLSEEPKHC